MPENTTPDGYTGAEAVNDLVGTGQEPAEVSEAKDTVHNVLDIWQQIHALEFTGRRDAIDLADEIVTELLNAGAVLPEQGIGGGANAFEHVTGEPVPADFERILSPMGKHLPWGVAIIGRGASGATAVQEGQHTLFHGGTGSGKTLALQYLALSALSRGYDITVIDMANGGLDWQWLGADAEVITSVPSAAATLQQLNEENERIFNVLKHLGNSSTYALNPDQRREHDIRLRLVILDGGLESVCHNSGSLDNEHRTLTRPIKRLLTESRAAGVTVAGSWQQPLGALDPRFRENFVTHIGFDRAAIKAADSDGHDLPPRLPKGTAYVQPGEYAAQVWSATTEELADQLPVAREARKEYLEILSNTEEQQ